MLTEDWMRIKEEEHGVYTDVPNPRKYSVDLQQHATYIVLGSMIKSCSCWCGKAADGEDKKSYQAREE